MLLLARLVEGIPSLDEGNTLAEDNGMELEIVGVVVDSEVPGVVEDSVTEPADCVPVEDNGIELEVFEAVVDSELPGVVKGTGTEYCVLVKYLVVAISLVTSPDFTLPSSDDEEVAS